MSKIRNIAARYRSDNAESANGNYASLYERKLIKQAEKVKSKIKKLAIARKLAYVNDMA